MRFKLKSFSSMGCQSNGEPAQPQLAISGNFFNAGGGDPSKDVTATLVVFRRTDDPSLPPTSLRVLALAHVGQTPIDAVALGTVEVDEAATATLHWDRASHAFVARVVKTVTRPLAVAGTMPYTEDDTTPPPPPFKEMQVYTLAPNCTTGRSFAAMEAMIQSVRVNALQ